MTHTACPEPPSAAAPCAVPPPPAAQTPPERLFAALRLIRSPRVGPASWHRLLAEFGSPQAALEALPARAAAAGMEGWRPCPPEVIRAEIRAAARAGARALLHGEPGYPPRLAELPDAPPVLWVIGDLAVLCRPSVAIVGARNASSAGLRMAAQLGAELAAAGYVVVSGLARGIDAAAHAASLEGGTVAVVPAGFARITPAENADLARRIPRTGALITEHPPAEPATARHFPRRNRLIAGLALGTVVVEAAARSGSLITAAHALELGREVMAVPAHPFDPRGRGANALIRDGATLIRGAEDVIECLAPLRAAAPAPRPTVGSDPGIAPTAAPGTPAEPEPARPGRMPTVAAPAPAAGPEAGEIVGRLALAPQSLDSLLASARESRVIGASLAALMRAELAGRVTRLPGGMVSARGRPPGANGGAGTPRSGGSARGPR